MDNPSVKKASSGNSTIALSVIIGIIIGFLVDQLLPSEKTQADSANINASIAQYISDNPEAIETALIALNDQRNRDKELQALNLLSAVEDMTVMGNPDGDITIYEFSDYNCGYCKRVFADLIEVMNTDGNIRLVVKEFPILAESSVDAARLALHAADQGKYDAVHTALMEWRGAINATMLQDLAATHDITSFDINNRDNDPMIAILRNNYDLGQRFQIDGTPGFIIGGKIYPGAISKDDMIAAVAEARRQNKS
jgi:protein-disulfide isomerase